jgi:hypothetical protein
MRSGAAPASATGDPVGGGALAIGASVGDGCIEATGLALGVTLAGGSGVADGPADAAGADAGPLLGPEPVQAPASTSATSNGIQADVGRARGLMSDRRIGAWFRSGPAHEPLRRHAAVQRPRHSPMTAQRNPIMMKNPENIAISPIPP